MALPAHFRIWIFLKNKTQSVSSFLPVQFSHSVVSDSLRPLELQHARPPCPSPTPGVHPNARPPSRWCHPAISSSVVPFSSCPQSLPASESFPMSQLFAWVGQSTRVSALASVLNAQNWSPLGWTGWISLQSILKVQSGSYIYDFSAGIRKNLHTTQPSCDEFLNWVLWVVRRSQNITNLLPLKLFL